MGTRGVIAHSGCADTFTGEKGKDHAIWMSREAGRVVSGEMRGKGESSVIVMFSNPHSHNSNNCKP